MSHQAKAKGHWLSFINPPLPPLTTLVPDAMSFNLQIGLVLTSSYAIYKKLYVILWWNSIIFRRPVIIRFHLAYTIDIIHGLTSYCACRCIFVAWHYRYVPSSSTNSSSLIREGWISNTRASVVHSSFLQSFDVIECTNSDKRTTFTALKVSRLASCGSWWYSAGNRNSSVREITEWLGMS